MGGIAMTYLGLDPGTACGWAVLDSKGKREASGVWNLRPSRHEGGGMRYVILRRKLADAIDGHRIKYVAYEEVRGHKGVDASHIYGGIIATLAALCEERRLPYKGVHTATVKKAATGSGRANKVDVMDAAVRRWDWPVQDDNEADALWVAECLRMELEDGNQAECS